MNIEHASIDRDRAQPLWQQIESNLQDDIASGQFGRGARLPPAGILARRLGVNRHTVRRALAALAQRGLLRVEPGRGTFVHDTAIDYPIGKRTRFRQNMDQLNVSRTCEVLKIEQLVASTRVTEALALVRRERAWRVEYTSRADGRAFDHCEAYFPAARFPGLDQVFARTHSVTATLAEFNVRDYFRRYTRVAARLPSAAVARVLEQPARRPVLEVESLNVDARGMPVQYGLTRFAGERVQLLLATD
jgi:GntR family phosphonate transport system transcriptional regulator